MARLLICDDETGIREIIKKYDPEKLTDGYHTVDGGEIFYISNPALGLWTADK